MKIIVRTISDHFLFNYQHFYSDLVSMNALREREESFGHMENET